MLLQDERNRHTLMYYGWRETGINFWKVIWKYISESLKKDYTV